MHLSTEFEFILRLISGGCRDRARMGTTMQGQRVAQTNFPNRKQQGGLALQSGANDLERSKDFPHQQTSSV